MKQKFRKIVAVVLAVAMVVSSVTVSNIVKADDYSSITDWTEVTAEMDSTYSYSITENTLEGFQYVNFYGTYFLQIVGTNGTSKMTADEGTTIKIDGKDAGSYWFDKATYLAGIRVGDLTDNAYHTIELTGPAGDFTMVILKGSPKAGDRDSTTEMPAPVMVGNPWISLNGSAVLVAGLDVIQNAVTYNLYVDGVYFKDVYNGENIPVTQFEAGSHLFQVSGVNSVGESALSEGYTLEIPGTTTTTTTAVDATDTESTPADDIDTDANLIKTTSPVKASSFVENGFEVEKAVDRNISSSSRWAADSNNNTDLKDGEWIYVDLGSVYDLSSMVLVWENLPLSGYKIYVATDLEGDKTAIGSVDTTVWSEVKTVTDSQSGTNGNRIALTNATGRYVMVYALSKAASYGVSIYEIGAYGSATTTSVPTAPIGVTVSAAANLTWNAEVNAKSYKIYVGDTFVTRVSGDTTSYDLSSYLESLDAESVNISVSAVGVAGESDKTTATYTKAEQQAAPEGLKAELIDNNTAVEITWTKSDNAEKCVLYIDGVLYDNAAAGVITGNPDRIEITNTLKTNTKLTAGDHTFAIAAVTDDAYGLSAQTEAVTVNIPVIQPMEVENLVVSDGINKLSVNFQESSTMKNAGQLYDVYIDGALKESNVNQGLHEYTDVTVGTHTVKVVSKILNNQEGHTFEYIQSTGQTGSAIVYNLLTPTDVNVTAGTNTISLTWKDTIKTSNYSIYLNDDTEPVFTTEVGADRATISNVSGGTYKVTIKAHVLNAYSDSVTVEDVVVYNEPTKVETIDVTKDFNTFTASWTDTGDEYEVTVLNSAGDVVDITPVKSTDDGVVYYTYDGVDGGKYTVSVIAKNPLGLVTAATTKIVWVVDKSDEVLVSDEISVEGFQIRTNDTNDTVAFRTVCKAPNVGSIIIVGGQEYEVASMGTIYALDSNTSGDSSNNEFGVNVTTLNETPVYNADVKYTYVGEKFENTTFGYIATSAEGYLGGWNEEDTTHTYYARTMEKMDVYMANELHVRAFIVATDGTIIYGTDTALTSVGEIADNIYRNSMAKNYAAHQYLYSDILNSTVLKNAGSKYYTTTKVSYGWNGNLYDPDPTDTPANNYSLERAEALGILEEGDED